MKINASLVAFSFLFLIGCGPTWRLVRHKDPLSTEEHLQLGRSYEKQKLAVAAERQYRSAIHLDKKNLTAYLALGNLLCQQNRWKEGQKVYRQAHRIDPHNAAVTNNLAMVLAVRKINLKKAEKLAKKASEDSRFRPYALDTLATVYIHQGRKNEAQNILHEARASAPADNPDFLAQIEKTESRLNFQDEKKY